MNVTDAPTKREREGALGLLQGLACVTDTFFVDGIHDDILTRITRIGAMKGIAPTSVERFRDTNLATGSLRQASFRPMSEISAQGGHMFESHRSNRTILIAAALALIASTPAWSQASGAGDAREINSYKLTDAGLAKYTQAGRNLEPLAAKAAADCGNDDSDDSDESNNGTTIDQAVAKLNSTAGAAAAIKSAGMTTREYVVFSMAVFQSGMAAWALSQPGGKLPPGVSMDNVNFYRKHQAALETLGQNTKSADCDDE